MTDFPISCRLTSLALWQSNDCPSTSKATLMNMDKYFMWIHYERLHNHNKAKHNKTVCIFLGIYCIKDIFLSSHYGSCRWPFTYWARGLLQPLQKFIRLMIIYPESFQNSDFSVVRYWGIPESFQQSDFSVVRYWGIPESFHHSDFSVVRFWGIPESFQHSDFSVVRYWGISNNNYQSSHHMKTIVTCVHLAVSSPV